MDVRQETAVARAQAGDEESFRVLVESYSPKVFRLAFRMTGTEHDADDVVQETFLRAYRQLRQFEARANFSTWLYRITANCSLDVIRKRRREVPVMSFAPQPENEQPDPVESVASDAPLPDRLLLSSEMKRRVELSMARLSPVERTAFVLRHFEDMSIEEIGRILSLRTSATKNTIFRAVQKLRHDLEPLLARAPGNLAGTR